jgi:FkbM family methyltransferase
MIEHLKKLRQYISLFGLAGLKFATRTALSRDSVELAVNHPSLDHAVYLRSRSSDVSTFWQVVSLDEYRMPPALAPSVIIDAGANIGLSTAIFASRYPNSSIIALEPDSENFDRLKKNTKDYQNVTCLNVAIWYESTSLPWVDVGLGNVGYRLASTLSSDMAATPRGSIQAWSVPDLLSKLKLLSVSILKMDIEGAEVAVLTRNNMWLSQVETLVVEFHDFKIRETLDGYEHLQSGFETKWRSGENNCFSRHPQLVRPYHAPQ